MAGKKVDLEKIKHMRRRAHLTLEDMAEKIGYGSLNGYYYLERGRSRFPAETLWAVAEILDVPIEELFVDPNEKRDKT